MASGDRRPKPAARVLRSSLCARRDQHRDQVETALRAKPASSSVADSALRPEPRTGATGDVRAPHSVWPGMGHCAGRPLSISSRLPARQCRE